MEREAALAFRQVRSFVLVEQRQRAQQVLARAAQSLLHLGRGRAPVGYDGYVEADARKSRHRLHADTASLGAPQGIEVQLPHGRGDTDSVRGGDARMDLTEPPELLLAARHLRRAARMKPAGALLLLDAHPAQVEGLQQGLDDTSGVERGCGVARRCDREGDPLPL